jgi:hypothetical protein
LKPTQANNSQDSISKKPFTKKREGADEVAQGIGPEFKPQYWKKKIDLCLGDTWAPYR